MDLNLHPYYPSVRGLARFPGHPRCSPELAASAARALRAALPADTSVFVGWQDECHDQEGQRLNHPLAEAVNWFNRT